MKAERGRHPVQRQPQPPKPSVYAEVIIHFRPAAPRRFQKKRDGRVLAFRSCSYALQPFPSGTVLVVQEQVGDHEAHVFHWEDIERLKVVPSSVALIETS